MLKIKQLGGLVFGPAQTSMEFRPTQVNLILTTRLMKKLKKALLYSEDIFDIVMMSIFTLLIIIIDIIVSDQE